MNKTTRNFASYDPLLICFPTPQKKQKQKSTESASLFSLLFEKNYTILTQDIKMTE